MHRATGLRNTFIRNQMVFICTDNKIISLYNSKGVGVNRTM